MQEEKEQLVEFDNPFKEYGALHNEVLGEILEITSKTGLSEEKIISAAKKVASARGLTKSKSDSEFPYETIQDIYGCLDGTIEDMSASLVKKGYASEAMNEKLVAFSQLVSETEFHSLSLDEIRSRLIYYEWSIVNDKQLPKEERDAMLVFTAVAKGSLDFWHNYNKANGEQVKAGWRFWFVVGADAAAWAGCIFAPGGVGLGWGSIVSATISGLAHHVVH